MRFQIDEFMEEERPAPAQTRDREMVPEDTHDFTIERASEEGDDLKLALRHADDRYAWVWANTPTTKDWGKRILSSLAKALGLSPAQWNALEVGELVGRQVRAEIYHKIGNSGRTFVNVRKFLASGAAPAPAAKAKPKRPAAAPAIGDDDIPF